MKNRIDYNNDNKIVLHGTFKMEVHSKETFKTTWTRQCSNFYRLVDDRDDFKMVDRFKNNIEIIAGEQFDKILNNQLNNPIDIDEDDLIDRTK